VDDGEYGVTDVVRAPIICSTNATWTERQLSQAADPRYAHLPVAVDQRGEKLSKQTKAAPVDLTRPLLVVEAVLRFLNQPVPDDLCGAAVPELWRYAIDRWDLQRVGRRLKRALRARGQAMSMRRPPGGRQLAACQRPMVRCRSVSWR
jgi:glutamyl-Q tRNA(Asp) synthetase